MKRFVTIALVFILTLSLSICAFAAVDGSDDDPNLGKDAQFIDESSISIPVEYKLTNGASVSPAETFNFVIAKYSCSDSLYTLDTMPAFSPASFSVAFNEGEATTVGDINHAVVTLPEFEHVGIFTYTINQTAGNTAGVTYDDTTVYLKVTAIEQDGIVRIIATYYGENPAAKGAMFVNEYSAAPITIGKTVTGNMGEQDRYFAIKVTLTNPEGKSAPATYAITAGTSYAGQITEITADQENTVYLKHGETLTIENVPYGVTYTVVEDDYTAAPYSYDAAEYAGSDVSNNTVNGLMDAATENVQITNNKGTDVDTGVELTSLPYILTALASLGGGAAVFFARKRKANAED